MSSSSVKKFGLPTIFWSYLAERIVSDSDRDVRERDECGREEIP